MMYNYTMNYCLSITQYLQKGISYHHFCSGEQKYLVIYEQHLRAEIKETCISTDPKLKLNTFLIKKCLVALKNSSNLTEKNTSGVDFLHCLKFFSYLNSGGRKGDQKVYVLKLLVLTIKIYIIRRLIAREMCRRII